jgi:pimeloyl-ACP methyl ester carboxylesterase
VADTSYDAPAGTFVMIPPGAPHTFANPGDTPAVLLNTFTPDLYVQYFRDLLQIADPDYGRAYAAAIPIARFQLLTDTGHLPQLEAPQQLMNAIWNCADTDFSGQRGPGLT